MVEQKIININKLHLKNACMPVNFIEGRSISWCSFTHQAKIFP